MERQRDDDDLRRSYNIPIHIAKSGEPHTLEEHLTLPTVEEILNIVLHEPAFNIIKRIL